MKKKIFAVLFSAIMMMSLATVSVSANDDECHPDKPHIVEYRRYDDTHHYKACTIEGCTYTTSKEECYGGTADCKNKAICNKCGMKYGDYEHSLVYVKNKDNTTHTAKCDKESCNFTEKQYCIYENDECKLCSREKPEVDILDAVNKILNKKSGQTLVLYPNKTIIPVEYLEAAIKNKADFYVNYTTYEWQISNVRLARNLDLSIKTEMGYLVEQNTLKSLKGDNTNVIQIQQEGDLGLKGILRYRVDKKYSKKYVNLYHYNLETKKLTYKGSTEVSPYGFFYLPFTQGGVYVLNITNKPVSNNLFGDLSAGESATVVEGTLPTSINDSAVTDAPATTDAAANPETGNSAAALMAIPMVVAAAAVISKKR